VICSGPCSPEDLKLSAEPLPPELGWGEVAVALQYAPINPADIYSARLGGVYGPESVAPPFVCGHDGVAVVTKVRAAWFVLGRTTGVAVGASPLTDLLGATPVA
jgi:NADPH:quinone reductase-like Zn-dependent oxidoreductase